jgi:diguanylate cyclase (GGDEF)-like protein
LKRLLEGTDAEIRKEELRRFMRSTTAVELLSLLLVALVLVLSPASTSLTWPLVALMAAFAAAIVMFRSRRFFPRQTRLKLAIESWAMVVFTTGVLWFTGRGDSPLVNLYLLPIIVSALTLGRFVTLLQVALIAVCHLALTASMPSHDVLSLAYLGVAAGQLLPFLLVAYLTTSLSADISEAREQIESLAQTDALTGLLNLRAFTQTLREQQTRSPNAAYAILMIDLDRLKHLNDTYGHEAGDRALELVARSLQRCIRTTDIAARYGGDEFVALLPGASAEAADAVVKRLRSSVFNTTLDLRSRMVRCSVSCGVALYPKDGREPRELLSVADQRMYEDKALRRGERGDRGAVAADDPA